LRRAPRPADARPTRRERRNALLGGGAWSHVWIYLVGPFAGAALAALVFGLQEQVGG
jgi:glycerol uptake facilitator-like aquaporin